MSSPPMRSRHRICRRMPFIFGSDGSYDHDPNRFFRACPTMSMRSPDSLHAYARDIVVWIRFPEERHDGKSLWTADCDGITAFHEARRLSARGIVFRPRRGTERSPRLNTAYRVRASQTHQR